MLQFDDDGKHLVGETPKLLDCLGHDGTNLVIGLRFLGKGPGFRSTFAR